MFDKKSDYALNKREKDAIVYINATGASALLTRADFSSEEEFWKWKAWSDSDYKETEKAGREFYDNCISLDEQLDCVGAVPSLEDELFAKQAEAEHIQDRSTLLEQVRNNLTEKQFRRLWMFNAEGMTVDEVALAENISQQAVSKSILTSKQRIVL